MEKQKIDEVIDKIMEKKEFSELLREDVKFAVEIFIKKGYLGSKLIKESRNYLRKIFSSFTPPNLLKLKNFDSEIVLLKHKSTKERFKFYEDVYSWIFRNFSLNQLSVIDLGAGVNGFSYKFFDKLGYKVRYFGVEGVGQLVELTNHYFRLNSIDGVAYHKSLFNLKDIKNLVEEIKGPKVIFLFKTIDSLEMFEKDYSKKFISEISEKLNNTDFFVVSFATRSLGRREKLKVRRYWIINFINDNFNLLDNFEIGGERYLVFKNK